MVKDIIIEHKRKVADWAKPLKQVPDDLWFQPFKEGSWGTAEVISHFIFWDRFVIDNRLKPFLQNEALIVEEVDVQKVNDSAAEYARKGSTSHIIDEFISVREELIGYIGMMSDASFFQKMPGKTTSWELYFKGLIDHDSRHQSEIDAHLKRLLEEERSERGPEVIKCLP